MPGIDLDGWNGQLLDVFQKVSVRLDQTYTGVSHLFNRLVLCFYKTLYIVCHYYIHISMSHLLMFSACTLHYIFIYV